MARIILAGPFLWIWGAWHLVWLGLLIWAGVLVLHGLDPRWVLLCMAALYTVFLPLEIAGVVANARSHGDGVARTLSEFRQFLGVNYGKSKRGLGWKALSGYSGLVDALIVGFLAYQLEPVIGTTLAGALAAILSSIMALTLIPHLGWREWVG